MRSNAFFLGTHLPSWLALVDIPLFISRRRLCNRRTFPRARGIWVLDSGGYSELSSFGTWTIDAKQYVSEVELYSREIGDPHWVAIQDWMCEPWILEKTGLTVSEHQARTTQNYLELCHLAPHVPWAPILQGWTRDDYLRHVDQYYTVNVDLAHAGLVGLGSVCRRQHTEEVEELIRELHPIPLHGFGFKQKGLTRVGTFLASADSLAWSFAARYAPPLPGCHHKNCANCLKYALCWRRHVLKLFAKTQEKN